MRPADIKRTMEVTIGPNSYSATPSDYPAQELNQLAEVNVKLGGHFKSMVVACNFAQQRDIIEDTPRIVIANRVYDLTLQRGIVLSASGEIIVDLEPLQDAKLDEINTAIIRRVKIRDQDYVTVPHKYPNERRLKDGPNGCMIVAMIIIEWFVLMLTMINNTDAVMTTGKFLFLTYIRILMHMFAIIIITMVQN